MAFDESDGTRIDGRKDEQVGKEEDEGGERLTGPPNEEIMQISNKSLEKGETGGER